MLTSKLNLAIVVYSLSAPSCGSMPPYHIFNIQCKDSKENREFEGMETPKDTKL